MTWVTAVTCALPVLFSVSHQEFVPGRIREGSFEYSKINGRMTTSEARLMCEADVKCGGFTLQGLPSGTVKNHIYFFHFVSKVRLRICLHHYTWEWMSYIVSRKFLIFKGSFVNWRKKYNTNINMHKIGQNLDNQASLPHTKNDSFGEYDNLIKFCGGLDACVAISQSKHLDKEVVVFNTLNFMDYTENPNWVTVISLDADESRLVDKYWSLNRCCPPTAHYAKLPDIKVFPQQQITRIPCNISAEQFRNDFVRTRTPVVLEGCIDSSLFTTNPNDHNWLKFNNMDFDEILRRVWYGTNTSTILRSRPNLRRKLISSMRQPGHDGEMIPMTYQKIKQLYMASLTETEDVKVSPSWTHGITPNIVHETLQIILEDRAKKTLRTFIKTSSMTINLKCYEKYRQKGTDLLKDGYESCLLLDGLWKPPPLSSDLYELTQYNNDIAWILMSSRNTGSEIHEDPDLMGAWNALLLGRKWWVVAPLSYHDKQELRCNLQCSPGSEDPAHVWPWFKHVLPQLRDKKFYGKSALEVVQEPGQVFYLPHAMPHAVFNIDDNVAVTENYLFSDALPTLMKAMALDVITKRVKWNEERAFRNIYYKYANKEDRERMRGMYDHITDLIRRFPEICEQESCN